MLGGARRITSNGRFGGFRFLRVAMSISCTAVVLNLAPAENYPRQPERQQGNAREHNIVCLTIDFLKPCVKLIEADDRYAGEKFACLVRRSGRSWRDRSEAGMEPERQEEDR